MSSVVQEWLANKCSWKEQTVLFSIIRGLDCNASAGLKAHTKWFRSVILKNADPTEQFMQNEPIQSIKEMYKTGGKTLIDMLPVHYIGHLMHSFEIVSYRHPDEEIRKWASEQYLGIVEYFHLEPESNENMTERLGDNRGESTDA